MTAAVTESFEPVGRRVTRWGAGLLGALTLHAAIIAAAILIARSAEPDDGGVIEMDLPPLAVEMMSTIADNSEKATDADTAPPPSDADSPPEMLPPDAQPVEKSEEPAPEPPLETSEPVEEATPEAVPDPPVPESPLAPEPEVVLPKPPDKPETKDKRDPEQVERKKPAPKKAAEASKETGKEPNKRGPKSDSKAASSAAASGGKFSPNAISRPHPAYPSSARASKIEGYVVVRYTVAPSGAVTSVSVVSANPAGVFNGVTVAAVRRWRFRPSASGGVGTTTIRFKLR
jgi:protein TonB